MKIFRKITILKTRIFKQKIFRKLIGITTQPIKKTHSFKTELIMMLRYRTIVFLFTYKGSFILSALGLKTTKVERVRYLNNCHFMTFAYSTKLVVLPNDLLKLFTKFYKNIKFTSLCFWFVNQFSQFTLCFML